MSPYRHPLDGIRVELEQFSRDGEVELSADELARCGRDRAKRIWKRFGKAKTCDQALRDLLRGETYSHSGRLSFETGLMGGGQKAVAAVFEAVQASSDDEEARRSEVRLVFEPEGDRWVLRAIVGYKR